MNYKAVLLADPELKELIRENKIKNLEKAALISNIQSSEVKQMVTQACLSGVPLKKLKVMAELENRKRHSVAKSSCGYQSAEGKRPLLI